MSDPGVLGPPGAIPGAPPPAADGGGELEDSDQIGAQSAVASTGFSDVVTGTNEAQVTERETSLQIVTSQSMLIQEYVRAFVTILFIAMLAYVVYYAGHGPSWKDQKEWLAIVLPTISGLLGSALGFYFGTRKLS